ncbi:MAG: Thymidylate kinase [Planctomycetes bacterium]|nr:Thymidylate kinase [Planctomycetota bacterium]
MNTVGQLFVFEGPNEVGKSTLSRLLHEDIMRSGKPCTIQTFPSDVGGTLGAHLRNLLTEHSAFGVKDISAAARQALHIAAHIDALQLTLLPQLRSGTTVVLDRFWWSTIVYGQVAGVDLNILNGLVDVELRLWQDITPTCLFLVKREVPLSGVSTEEWRCISNTYDSFLDFCVCQHDVQRVFNESTIGSAFEQVLSAYNRHAHP